MNIRFDVQTGIYFKVYLIKVQVTETSSEDVLEAPEAVINATSIKDVAVPKTSSKDVAIAEATSLAVAVDASVKAANSDDITDYSVADDVAMETDEVRGKPEPRDG